MISPMLWCSLLYNYNALQIALSAVLDHVNFKILYSTAIRIPLLTSSFASLNAYSSVWVLNQEMLAEWCDIQLFRKTCFLKPVVPQ